MTIRAKGRGVFDYRLEIAGATIAVPTGCPTANLTTAFIVDDGVNPTTSVSVTSDGNWRCFGTQNRYLRIP
jgi:hypothetical protein